MILGTDLLTELGLNIKFSECVIEADYGPLKGSTALMFDMSTYEFKNLNTGNVTPGELFLNAYAEKIHELEHVHTFTKRLRGILYLK